MAGEIRGYVLDKETKEPLIGCNVYLKGTTVGTVSNVDGYYHLPLVKPGKYTLVASYIGYTDMAIEIEVVADEVLERNFELTFKSIGIEEVVVTAQAEGQINAINQQINANAIINVVSAKRIQELPDANAAESVGRLPGISLIRNNGEGDRVVIRGMEPKYNLITINGVRALSYNSEDNSVGLAGISPYMLESIEVQKSLTPDQEADVIGGIVNLRLRDAPEGFKGNIIFENVFNTLNKTFWNPKLTIMGSNRFIKNRLGIFLQANYESNNRPNDRMI